ncbi:MAG: ROK family protein [Candidatus Fimadaptatus sp.]|nr:ROK family protein [Candidatus Fimadaptatus sp.]
MSEATVWGLDIGGTKCALVIGDRTGEVLARWQVATADYGADWQRLINDLLKNAEGIYTRPLAAGVSCGGPLSSARGVIMSPPNLPGWDDVHIVEWLQNRLSVPAFLQNDANACALAEWQFGAGRGCKNMVFLTFGTGMGAGLILDGRLYAGTNDMAGEVGHVRLEPDGPEGYGKRGSFEGFCSGGGIRQLAQMELGKDLSCKQLCELADAGDADARHVLEKSADYLGRALAVLIDILNPERIVIGSIYARAERHFKDGALSAIRREALSLSSGVCEIVPAGLGDSIGDIAALSIAWNGLNGAR